jgi:hypothetical protein
MLVFIKITQVRTSWGSHAVLELVGIAAPLAAPFEARAQSCANCRRLPVRRINGRHHAAGPAGHAATPWYHYRDREPVGRLRQRRHRRGGEITTRRQYLVAVFDNHAANPFVLPRLPYDSEKDLDPVLLISTVPYMITTAKGQALQRHRLRQGESRGQLRLRRQRQRWASGDGAAVAAGGHGADARAHAGAVRR